jgi:hypothetical protein
MNLTSLIKITPDHPFYLLIRRCIEQDDPNRSRELLGGSQARFEEPFEVHALFAGNGWGRSDSSRNISVEAVVCVALCSWVPESEAELEMLKGRRAGNVVVPYSLWSYGKGAGRETINQLLEIYGESHAIVTLSPVTDEAAFFHEACGAKLLSDNLESRNFIYTGFGIEEGS